MNEQLNKIVASVVIPCYNAIDKIELTLRAILEQQTNYSYEVLVIDSSDDGTDVLIKEKFPEVRLFHLPGKTLPGSGRNLGIREAKGEIVVFTDSDAVPDQVWLQKIVERYKSLNCDAVGGAVINGYPHSYIAWVSHLIEFNEWTTRSKKGYVNNIPTCNLSYKKSTFYKYKIEFSDNFPTEDTILNWFLISKGGKIYFDPEIKVVHLNRMTFKKLFKHQYRLGNAAAVERQITNLPGKILLKYPILCIGIPIVRWVLAFKRLMRCGIKLFFIFLCGTPLFLAAAIVWSIGFIVKGKPVDALIRIHE